MRPHPSLAFALLALGIASIPAPARAVPAPGDYFGSAVAGAGDLDGDGYADYLVGSSGAQSAKGRVDVFYGNAARAPELRLTLRGVPFGAAFGRTVAGIGDVDGDGFPDVAVGQPGYSDAGVPNGGRVWVYLGSDTGLVAESGVPLDGTIANGFLGSAVAAAGDVDGDGFADLLVGAPYAEPPAGITVPRNPGIVYVYHGSSMGIEVSPRTSFWGVATRQHRGFSLAGIGDFDNDSYDDVVVGAPYEETDFLQGRIYLHRGSPTGLLPASDSLTAGSRSGRFGFAMARTNRFDSHLIVGSPNDSAGAHAEAGGAYLVQVGPDGRFLPATLLLPGTQAGAHLGSALAGAGHFDHDDIGDLLVGERDYDGPGVIDDGRVHLVLSAPARDSILTTDQGTLAQFGLAVAGLGDVDGDGADDVAIGAPGTSAGGEVTVAWGTPGEPTSEPELPEEVILRAPRPNPWLGSASLSVPFSLPARATVEVTLHEAVGGRVRVHRSVDSPAGHAGMLLPPYDDAGRRLAPGVYFLRVSTGTHAMTSKVVRVR